MKMQVFAVLDKQAGAYLRPFFEGTKGMAIRAFSDAVADEKSPFHRHAEDYVLYFFGEFDDGSGAFATREPERLIGAHEALVQR